MFVLAMGEGVSNNWPEEKKDKRSWNAGLCCSTAWKDGVDDVGYVIAVLDHLQQRYCVDTQNVYVAGHANGGMMAYRLACQLSSRVAAIAVSAGSLLHLDYQSCLAPCGRDSPVVCTHCFSSQLCPADRLAKLPHVFPCLMDRHVSVLHVHGAQDTRVPYSGGVGLRRLGNATFPPVHVLLGEYLGRKYKCSSETRLTFVNRTNPDDTTVCEEYLGCSDARIQLCTLKNGGHHLPGADLPGFCDTTKKTYKRDMCFQWTELLGPFAQSLRFAETSWTFFKSVSNRPRGNSKGPRSAYSTSDKNCGSLGVLQAFPILTLLTLMLIGTLR